MFAPVRGGNRGGWDQFKWDDVRLMPYKDRECYLGASEKLGYLDKGGKWRKRDWWIEEGAIEGANKSVILSNTQLLIQQKQLEMEEQLRREKEQIRKEDEAVMRVKLGLDPYQDTKTLLQQLDYDGSNPMMTNRLTEYEMKELVQKGGVHAFEQGAQNEEYKDEKEYADRVGGLGNPQHISGLKPKVWHPAGMPKLDKSVTKLEGEGLEQLKYMDQQKKLVMINYLKEKIEQQKKEKKERKELKKQKKLEKKLKKKEKKEKKHGKNKKRRSHSSSSSSSNSDRDSSRSRSKDKQKHKRQRYSSAEKEQEKPQIKTQEKPIVEQKDSKNDYHKDHKRRSRSRSNNRDSHYRRDTRSYKEDHNDKYRPRQDDKERKDKREEPKNEKRKRDRSEESVKSDKSSSSFLSY